MDRVRQTRASWRGRLPAAAALLALLCALAAGHRAGRARPSPKNRRRPREPPSFVVIQTDDQTLDGLYATFTAFAGAPRRGRCRTRST